MNNLLLLIILVSIICLMNNKDLMKSVSTKAKSMNMDDTTLLVVVFVVVVLFMCMSKKVEGLTTQVNGVCPNGSKLMHVYDPDGDKNKHIPMCFINESEVNIFTKLLRELNITNRDITDKGNLNEMESNLSEMENNDNINNSNKSVPGTPEQSTGGN
jgi:hypothetical protein